jgi:hypothetical protein
VDFGADHAQGFGAGVYVVETWADCFDVPTEFLIDAVVGLGDGLVGVFDEAAAEAGGPGTHASAALAPAMQTRAVKRQFLLMRVHFWQIDMLGFASESIILILHFECL